MRSGGTRVSSIRPYPLSVGLGCCRGSSFLYCSAVPLVVCHVNSSQRGTVSALLFRSALFFPPRVPNLCPSRFSTSNAPRSSARRWSRLSAELTAGKSGSHLFVSLTPRSQWPCLTMGPSPLPLVSLPKLGRVNIYQPPQQWPVRRRKGLTRAYARLLVRLLEEH